MYSTDNAQVISVWSAYGHTFLSSEPPYVACLTCGAMYQLLADADNPSHGAYMAMNGDDPMHCTGDTGMAHGYPGERHCDEHEDPCGHVEHDCNCCSCA